MPAPRYMDGKSAQSHPVSLSLEAQSLQLRDQDGRLLASWARDRIRLVAFRNGEVVLGSQAPSDERLVLSRSDLPAGLEGLLAKRRQSGDRLPWPILLLSLPVLVGLYYLFPLAVRPVAALIPQSWEQSLGASLAEGFDGAGLCQGESGQAALERLAQRIAVAGGVEVPVVKVVRRGQVNAVTFPGGQIRVFSGLVRFAQTPEELAGVLAHEMAHAKLRHVTQNMVRSAGLGLLVAMLTGDSSGLTAGALQAVISLSYSREDEAEADRVGLEMLAKAGIEGTGMSSFFVRMAEKEGTSWSFLSTHPESAGRSKIADQHARHGGPALTGEEYQAIKKICG